MHPWGWEGCGTGVACGKRVTAGGLAFFAACRLRLAGTQWGLAFFVACLPFTLAFDSAPIPPSPFPAGRGRPRLFQARGFAPCIPGAGRDAALGLLVESGVRRGAYLPCRLLALPLVFFLAPIPPPRARRALFPAGRGRPRLFQARGFAPCIPGAGRDAALGLLVESGLRRGACPGGTGAWWALMRPAGGLAFFAACRPCPEPSLFFIPTSRQEDRAQTIGFSQYSIFGKSSGGSGGLFQESPSVLPSVLPVPSANAVRRERVRERPSRCMTV